MKYDNLNFSLINDDGEEVTCDIISIIQNEENRNEPYVVFTDYMLDENKKFVTQYGKIIEENGEYTLKKINEIETINKIKESIANEIINYAREQI